MLRRANQQKLMKALFFTLGVLIVMLIVVLIFIVTGTGSTEQQVAKAVESAKFVQGVSVAGIDVSGLKYDEAADNEQLKAKAGEAAGSFTYTFTVEDKVYTYTAEELGLKADIEKTLENAIKWGNVGTGDETKAQKEEALSGGKDFAIAFDADTGTIESFIREHKSEYDTLAKNATVKITDAAANPPFEFVDEENGIDVDAAKLAALMSDNINNGDYSQIAAPVLITAPTLDVTKLKANFSTEPIATYTSSFAKGHLSAKNRVNNVKIMGSFVNGTVIEPLEVWSLNDTAGPRDATTAKTVGWTLAPGLQDGTSTDQYGGGVCQISSTTYNAAILADLTIVQRFPHSWPSEYIPAGMDATVTTGLKDLQLENPNPDYPVLLTCIVDETEKTATVNIYGPQMKYAIKFTTKKIKDEKPGAPVYYYNQTVEPDGTEIPANTSVTYVSPKHYLIYEVYKHYLDKDGNEVSSGLFTTTAYQPYPAEIYCNYPKSGPVETASPS
jgi:vancomycin resistance protein YoaR